MSLKAYNILSEQIRLNEFFFVYFGSKIRLPSGRIIYRNYTLDPADNPASVVGRWLIGEASLKANTREIIARNYLALQDLDMSRKRRDLEEDERKELYKRAVMSAGIEYLNKAKSTKSGDKRIQEKIDSIKKRILQLVDPNLGYGYHFTSNKLSYKIKYYETDYYKSL